MRTTRARTLHWLFLTLVLVLAVRQWVWMPTMIYGESMQPALRAGQLVGINKLAYMFGTPQRGDVVVVQTGKGLVVKRIIGVPGETLTMREGRFYINDVALPEPYVKFAQTNTIASGKLGAECFVVAGDNRPQSYIAVVKRTRIIGRIAPILTRRSW